jgi:hypothetical protein
MAEGKEAQQIKVTFPEHLQAGVYSNLMRVNHTREEFILDFVMVSPPAAVVSARVIMSPGHMKRTIAALQSNVKGYEGKFGKIPEAEEPTGKRRLGFHTG